MLKFSFKFILFPNEAKSPGAGQLNQNFRGFFGLRANVEMVLKLRLVTHAGNVLLQILASKFPSKSIPHVTLPNFLHEGAIQSQNSA